MASTEKTASRTCRLCGKRLVSMSRILPICVNCLRLRPDETKAFIKRAHTTSRRATGYPTKPPRGANGQHCFVCPNRCSIAVGESGFCGTRVNVRGALLPSSPNMARVFWNHEPIPSTCIADWICAAGSPAGYPRYSFKNGIEYGYKSLEVFLVGCNLDCLFCQNWRDLKELKEIEICSLRQLIRNVDKYTSCISFFGGDPAPQIAYALSAAQLAVKARDGKTLRICWETNGHVEAKWLQDLVTISLRSGGCIKFDLKAWNSNLHAALCGIGNRKILENFAYVAQRAIERPDPPLLVANTILIPGYIDAKEIRMIARFIASLNSSIPYALLAYRPQHLMNDLKRSSRKLALRSLQIAREEGLTNVRIINEHHLI